jgi:hypothetical protein
MNLRWDYEDAGSDIRFCSFSGARDNGDTGLGGLGADMSQWCKVGTRLRVSSPKCQMVDAQVQLQGPNASRTSPVLSHPPPPPCSTREYAIALQDRL